MFTAATADAQMRTESPCISLSSAATGTLPSSYFASVNELFDGLVYMDPGPASLQVEQAGDWMLLAWGRFHEQIILLPGLRPSNDAKKYGKPRSQRD